MELLERKQDSFSGICQALFLQASKSKLTADIPSPAASDIPSPAASSIKIKEGRFKLDSIFDFSFLTSVIYSFGCGLSTLP